MNDPTQLAALAALVGITPETHKHLWEHTVWYEPQEDDWYPMWYVMENAVKFRLVAPALDTPAGDDVFLAPVMRWLQEHDFNPSIVGLDFGHQSKFMFAADCFSMESMRRTNNFYDDTMTAALLRACQSAGVPEICAIFGEADRA
jgi:hypothetical protein